MKKNICITPDIQLQDIAETIATSISNEYIIDFVVEIDGIVADTSFTQDLYLRIKEIYQTDSVIVPTDIELTGEYHADCNILLAEIDKLRKLVEQQEEE